MGKTRGKSKTMTVGASSVIDDLQNSSDLVASQKTVGLSEDEVISKMFTSMLAKLICLEGTSDSNKAKISKAINQGPWSSLQKQELALTLQAESTGHVWEGCNGGVDPQGGVVNCC